MARYTASRYGAGRRWIYLVLLIAVVVVVVLIMRTDNDKQDPDEVSQQPTAPVEQIPEPQPEPEPEPEPELSQAIPEPVTEPNPEAVELIEQAMSLINAEPAQIIEARNILNETLLKPMNPQQRQFVKEQLSSLTEKWLFSRKIYQQDHLCQSYKIRPGEMLSTIGKRSKVPYQCLMEINSIRRPESLQAGEPLKIINGPFHLRVYRSTFTMDLYLQKMFVQSFKVGLGKETRQTPTGLWKVKKGGKLISPTWTDPDTGKTYEAEDPDYPLGSRWIALEGLQGDAVGRSGIAFHGTKDPDTIGTTGSRGCIRLHNGDAVLIYNLLVEEYSRVEVVD